MSVLLYSVQSNASSRQEGLLEGLQGSSQKLGRAANICRVKNRIVLIQNWVDVKITVMLWRIMGEFQQSFRVVKLMETSIVWIYVETRQCIVVVVVKQNRTVFNLIIVLCIRMDMHYYMI